MKIKLSPSQRKAIKTSKNVMKTAWKLARKAAAKFGCKASEFFLACLKTVWRAYNQKQLELFPSA